MLFFLHALFLHLIIVIESANIDGPQKYWHRRQEGYDNKLVIQAARVLMFKAGANQSGGTTPLQPLGIVDITECDDGTTNLNGTISGLTPGAHGFHFHQFGDISLEACLGAGAHYNPRNQSHGAPDAAVRHVGDLGNLVANAYGVALVSICHDRLVTLNGVHSVVGRALVVHQQRDDLGLGGNAGSAATGNSGARVACGIVGIIKERGNNEH